jgi:hypothetical protein
VTDEDRTDWLDIKCQMEDAAMHMKRAAGGLVGYEHACLGLAIYHIELAAKAIEEACDPLPTDPNSHERHN